jgi:hypothetical protein
VEFRPNSGKVAQRIGLPENAIVICVDEKPSIRPRSGRKVDAAKRPGADRP